MNYKGELHMFKIGIITLVAITLQSIAVYADYESAIETSVTSGLVHPYFGEGHSSGLQAPFQALEVAKENALDKCLRENKPTDCQFYKVTYDKCRFYLNAPLQCASRVIYLGKNKAAQKETCKKYENNRVICKGKSDKYYDYAEKDGINNCITFGATNCSILKETLQSRDQSDPDYPYSVLIEGYLPE